MSAIPKASHCKAKPICVKRHGGIQVKINTVLIDIIKVTSKEFYSELIN